MQRRQHAAFTADSRLLRGECTDCLGGVGPVRWEEKGVVRVGSGSAEGCPQSDDWGRRVRIRNSPIVRGTRAAHALTRIGGSVKIDDALARQNRRSARIDKRIDEAKRQT